MSAPPNGMIAITGTAYDVGIGGLAIAADTSLPLVGASAQLTGPAGGAFANWLAIYALQFPNWSTMTTRPDRMPTRSDGSFFFLNLPPDTYQVTVSAAGYTTASPPPVPVPANGPTQMVSVTLTPTNPIAKKGS